MLNLEQIGMPLIVHAIFFFAGSISGNSFDLFVNIKLEMLYVMGQTNEQDHPGDGTGSGLETACSRLSTAGKIAGGHTRHYVGVYRLPGLRDTLGRYLRSYWTTAACDLV